MSRNIGRCVAGDSRQHGKLLFLLVDDAAAALAWSDPAIACILQGHSVHVIGPDMLPGGRRTTHALARRVVADLRARQPKGSYAIAGWGDAGRLAYASAVLLLGLDEEVSFLALMRARTTPAVLLDDLPRSDAIEIHLMSEHGDPAWRSLGNMGGLEHDATPEWVQVLAPTRVQAHLVLEQQNPAEAVPPDLAADGVLDVSTWARAVAKAWQDANEVAAKPAAQHGWHLAIQRGQADLDPLICIPGAGDSITSFTSLAGALGSQRPVHGMQTRGVDGVMVPHASVEAAAASCLRAIQRVRPYGPLHLLGHSFGGWIAYELACRLSSQGRDVRSLTMVDTEVPDQQPELIRDFTCQEVLAEFIHHLELSVERPLGLTASELALVPSGERLKAIHEAMVGAGLLPRRSNPMLLRGPIDAFAAAIRTHYRPTQRFNGTTCLVYVPSPDVELSHGSMQGHHDRTVVGWRVWAPKLHHRMASGNHITVLKSPHVGELAQWWLENAAMAGRALAA